MRHLTQTLIQYIYTAIITHANSYDIDIHKQLNNSVYREAIQENVKFGCIQSLRSHSVKSTFQYSRLAKLFNQMMFINMQCLLHEYTQMIMQLMQTLLCI